MAITNSERVGNALELLNTGLQPFVEREMRAVHGERWLEVAQSGLRGDRAPAKKAGAGSWDTQALLVVMWDNWNTVFKRTLGSADRSLVSELKDTRNRWAHQNTFSTDDAYRALDSVQRLLTAISATEADEVGRQKQELLRARFDEEARTQRRRTAAAPVEGQPLAGLKAWREVVTPHRDVASGQYQQAEFAADLWQVYQREGSDEYRDPTEFFGRTFITEGLRKLLTDALQRLAGSGGDPVVELQTNFGGGKTHSLLALYHLFSGTAAGKLPGVEALLGDAGVPSIPGSVKRAVLVGHKISPGRIERKPDGTEVRTLWGELAWQLGGTDGYAMVAEDDQRATNPGDRLRELFNRYSPCLVLVDEWIRYAAQLHETPDLPGGTFDTQFTFAQALSEAAKAAKQTLLVVAIPASEIEFGGERGQTALERLRNAVGRVESPWRPASAEESFEIVRRRLFEPVSELGHRERDAVIKAFGRLYREQAQEFPRDCRERTYEERMEKAYPIHPELFDRLYNEWSTLEKFQRTRGVLRLMAAVIHTLWERQDASLVILPATVPMDAPAVQQELTRYLPDNWVPVIERDIDGPTSLPLQLDRANPNFGRYSASRRVARAIYLGSAPSFRATNRGIEVSAIRLGCVQPGETVATFGDALRGLLDRATHLYAESSRYWFDTHETLNKKAQDRALQYPTEEVHEEIRRRLRGQQNQRGDFGRVHPCPPASSDVPDEPEARLVILDPEYPHLGSVGESPAVVSAGEILDKRGDSPRVYRNALVFLAADKNRLGELETAARQFLAWQSIDKDKNALNLDTYQRNQAETMRERTDETVRQRVGETYKVLVAPSQRDPSTPGVEWTAAGLQGSPDPLATRVSKKLRNDDLLMVECGGVRLRAELDKVLGLWRGDHVSLKQLADDFARYLYLPRLKNAEVLVEAVKDGLRLMTWQQDTFAYASGHDETKQRYLGLEAGKLVSVSLSGGLLVRPDIAAKQIEREAEAASLTPPGATAPGESPVALSGPGTLGSATVPKVLRRFHGTVALDATRAGRDAGRIAEEVLQHVVGLVGADVKVALEIQAELPNGAPDQVVRTVTENCRTLKFKSFGFEET